MAEPNSDKVGYHTLPLDGSALGGVNNGRCGKLKCAGRGFGEFFVKCWELLKGAGGKGGDNIAILTRATGGLGMSTRSPSLNPEGREP